MVLVITATVAFSRRADHTFQPKGAHPSDRSASGVTMRWTRPGEFFPLLGWREPVSLRDSDLLPDRQLAELDPTKYNCHYYIRFLLRRMRGEPVLPIPRQDQLTESCLRALQLSPVQGPLAPGDILLAARPDGASGWRFTHSALVLAVDAAGVPTRIRQKFNDQYPVVDVTGEEFRMLYASRYPWHVQAWRSVAESTR